MPTTETQVDDATVKIVSTRPLTPQRQAEVEATVLGLLRREDRAVGTKGTP